MTPEEKCDVAHTAYTEKSINDSLLVPGTGE